MFKFEKINRNNPVIIDSGSARKQWHDTFSGQITQIAKCDDAQRDGLLFAARKTFHGILAFLSRLNTLRNGEDPERVPASEKTSIFADDIIYELTAMQLVLLDEAMLCVDRKDAAMFPLYFSAAYLIQSGFFEVINGDIADIREEIKLGIFCGDFPARFTDALNFWMDTDEDARGDTVHGRSCDPSGEVEKR